VLVRVGEEVQALPRGLTGRLGALAAVAGIALAGCGSDSSKTGACPTCPGVVAQTRADTYAAVARRTYRQEVFGDAGGSAFSHISSLPGLRRGLATGDYALARAALRDQPVRHAVRARVTRGSRVLVDVGLDFVIAGNPRPLVAGGRTLGQLEISIQDVIGFVKLVHRLTGTQVVVRGSLPHHAESSLPAALGAALPAKGPVTVGGRRYVASSFARPGFGGEQLSVWILAPA
jgi:hypothetical protein